MVIKGSQNLEFLIENFDFEKSNNQIKQGFILEGGSGSGKTYDLIQFLMYYCQQNKNKGKDILIFRETLADLKKTVYKDFEKILRMYGIYKDTEHTKSPPINYTLYGNTVYFSGLDTMGAHGERHDIIWGNEAMEINKEAFKQLNQRCNEAFFLDYNPSFTDHWIFDEVITRDDTKFFRSNQLGNPFLPEGQRKEILSYEPTEDNIRQGTADDYLWNVYGLGIRSAPEGLIFQHVTWVNKFPDNIEKVYYGIDFGYTIDPTAIIRLGVDGKNIYLEKLFYKPTESSNQLIPILKQYPDVSFWADSADPGMISELRHAGLKVFGVTKFHGSINYGISVLKKFKIHIVDSPEFRKEQSNYRYREIRGMKLDEPIDQHNHLWDASRYAAISNLRK